MSDPTKSGIIRSHAQIETMRERDALRAERDRAIAERDEAVYLLSYAREKQTSDRLEFGGVIRTVSSERDALRAALEEVCRCSKCQGSGSLTANSVFGPNSKVQCYICEGTGRDYHGSDAAKRLLEGGR